MIDCFEGEEPDFPDYDPGFELDVEDCCNHCSCAYEGYMCCHCGWTDPEFDPNEEDEE